MAGGVFISYRREDSEGFAGRIYDRLAGRLGRDNVFFDVDAIPPGRDFADVLSERVGKCDALIAVIGRTWAEAADSRNRRRLDDPNDFVRVEIEAALKRGVPVIPVLVEGAPMPRPEDLPDGLKELARRQAIEISHTRFDSDAERLTDALAQIEGRTAAGAASVKGRRGLAARLIPLSFAVLAVAGGAVFLYGAHGARTRDAATAGSGDWRPAEEFRDEFKKKAAEGLYPDSGAARCDGGVVMIRAHWAERPPGMKWAFFRLSDEAFASKNSDLVGQGFALKYDNAFTDCDGRNGRLALWTKG